MRAKAEGEYLHRDSMDISLLFFGIQKLSELNASKIFPFPEKDLKRIDDEISLIRRKLLAYETDFHSVCGSLRHQFRYGLAGGAKTADACLQRAAQLAESRGDKMILAIDLLRAILEDPAPALQKVLPKSE
jgi:hypothetical protein